MSPFFSACSATPLSQDLIEPVKRLLGTRTKHGATVHDYCYDLPVDKTLFRLLQHCPRAREAVLAFQERMHERAHQPPPPSGTVITLVDLCDGHVYRDHPVLGDIARAADPTHFRSDPADPTSGLLPRRLPLSLVLYYDDVEPANSLGHARVVHKLGCFYYALVDLGLGLRQQLQFIIPFTFALAKDVTRYGPVVLAGRASSPAYSSCTSLGATLQRLSRDAQQPVVWSFPHPILRQHNVHVQIEVYALCLASDMPAAACLGPWMRSVGAQHFDRRSYLDSHDEKWKMPNSFMPFATPPQNSHLPHRWRLRCQSDLQRLEAKYEQLRCQAGGKAKAKEALQQEGINTEWAFDYSLKHIPYFDVTVGEPQDAMHIYLVSGGLAGLELGAFLYLNDSRRIFSVEAFNARLASFRFGGERLPQLYESLKQGQAGRLPRRDAHTQWTAGHMKRFMQSAIAVLEPLVSEGLVRAEEELRRGGKRGRDAPSANEIKDVQRAWESFKALHAEMEVCTSLSPSPQHLESALLTHSTGRLRLGAHLGKRRSA